MTGKKHQRKENVQPGEEEGKYVPSIKFLELLSHVAIMFPMLSLSCCSNLHLWHILLSYNYFLNAC